MFREKAFNISFAISCFIHFLFLIALSYLYFYQSRLTYTLTEVDLVEVSLRPQEYLQFKPKGLPREPELLSEELPQGEEKIEVPSPNLEKETIYYQDELKVSPAPLLKGKGLPEEFSLAERKPIPRKGDEAGLRIKEDFVETELATYEELTAGELNISGPVAEAKRRVISRYYPTYPPGKQVEVTILLKFYVEPDGLVTNIVPLQRGDTELEKIACAAMRKWRFEPLPKNVPQVRQWGTIPLKFRLK
jgi:TonB family protein